MPTARLRLRWRVLVGLMVVVVAGACDAGDRDTPPQTSPLPGVTASPTGGATLGATCANPQLGYEIDYPAGWTINSGEMLPPCSLFDPTSADVEPGTEIPPSIAVAIRGSDLPFDLLATPTSDVQNGIEMIERTQTAVDGRDAVTVFFEAIQESPLLEPGTRGYRYLVDLGDPEPIAAVSTLVAVVYDVGDTGFDHKREVLDAMMDSLRFTDATAASPRTALTDGQAVALGFSETLTGLAVIDVSDGEVVRELPGALGEGASSLDYMPGRNVALYSRVVTTARSEIVEVPLDGTVPPHVLDVGYAVDAIDDGERVAVARRRLREGGGATVELEIRTDDDQVLASWTTRSTDELPAEPANLSWSPDGTRLAFDVRFEDGVSTFLIDVADAAPQGELFDIAHPVEPQEEQGAMASRPFWLPDGRFGLVLGCCNLPGLDTWSFVLVDPDSGKVTETLFEVDRGVGPVDVHSEQPRLLFTLSHDAFGDRGAPQPDRLMRWQSGQPSEIDQELQDAAW